MTPTPPSSAADLPRRRRWEVLAVGLGLGAALALLVIRPLYELFAVGAGELAAGGGAALDRVTAGEAMANSFTVALSSALLSVLGGVAAALITERSHLPGRRWMRIGILLPLLVPPFVSALSFLRAYGPSGLTDDSFGWSFPGLYGPVGIVTVITLNALPISYLIAAAALNSGVARDLERAARISGAGPGRAVWSITFPLLTPALVGAGLLSLVVGLNSFGVPAILGTPARYSTITTRIYQDLARSAQPQAFTRAIVLACGLVVCALVFTTLAEMLLGRTGTTPRTAAPAGPLASPRRHHRMTALAAWALIVATTGVPLLALILVALTRAVGLAPVPANWTLANFAEALSGRLLGSLGRSLLLATAAGLIAVGLGTAAALTHRWRGHRIVGAGVLLSFAVPGSTLAVAVLLAYGRALRDTLTLILIAYVAKLWALGHRSMQGSVRSLAPETTWAARASGASPATTLRSVTLPLLRPALFGAFVLVFLFAFHELTMSSLLYGPGTGTLAVAILNLQQIGDVPVTSALAVLLTVPLLIVTVPLLAVGRLSRRIMGTG